MDLKDFHFQNVSETEYHYRFHESISNVNNTYKIFEGYRRVHNYQFEVYDIEEQYQNLENYVS